MPPPITKDTNDEYVITTLMNDPELNTLFTLEKYNNDWNKATLIQTIKDILANGTSNTNPLLPVTLTPMPVKTFSPNREDSIPFLPQSSNTQNMMNIYTKDNNGNTIKLNYTGTGGNDGNINMQLENTSISPGSDITFQYNLPKSQNSILYGNEYVTMNDGPTKCVYKNGCTKKHFYRPNCQTIFIDDGEGKGTRCACNCSSEIVYNSTGKSHSHCETKDFTDTIINSLNSIQSVSVDIPVPTNFPQPTQMTGIQSYDPDIDYLSNLIADYYILLIENKQEQQMHDNTQTKMGIKNDTHHQSLEDSNQLYQGEYLKIINLSVGIFASTFFLFSILQ
jgi:hypothetical protein